MNPETFEHLLLGSVLGSLIVLEVAIGVIGLWLIATRFESSHGSP